MGALAAVIVSSTASATTLEPAAADVADRPAAAPVAAAVTAPPPTTTYQPVITRRLIDTRSDDGLITTPIRPLVGGEPLAATLTGLAGVPDDGVAAIDLNVTVVGMTAPGFIAVYPCADGNDGTSRLNYAPRPGNPAYAVAVQVLAIPDADGRVCFEALTDTHLVVDTSGWIAAGGGFEAVDAVRLVDTRDGTGATPLPAGQLTPETPIPITIAGNAGVPTDAAAVALSVVSVDASAPGFVSVFPCASGFQQTSNLNYGGPDPVANAVTAPLDPLGTFCVYALSATDVVIDLVGYYVADRGVDPVAPIRVLDSRDGTGGVPVAPFTALEPVAVDVVDVAGLPGEHVRAVSLNVTAVDAPGPGFVAVFPCADGWNGTSSVNYDAFEARPNAVFTPVDADGLVCFLASNGANVLADLDGWFGPAPAAIDDSATTAEDTPVTVDVLDNDVRGAAVAAITQPDAGTATITDSGTTITYTPDPNTCNDATPTDDLTYTLTPGNTTATLAVAVTCVDDPPIANDDSTTVAEDAPPTPIAVLANDTDIDAGPISIAAITQPDAGTATITDSGTTITYTPDPDTCNDATPTDDLTYTLTPGNATATLAVAVTCVDDDPVAIPDEFRSDNTTAGGPNDRNAIGNTRLTVGQPATGVAERMLAGSLLDNDADADAATALVVADVQAVGGAAPFTATTDQGGTVVVQADGSFVYDPPAGFEGDDTFVYDVSDGDGPTDTTTVTIEVAGMVWYLDSSAGFAGGTGTATDPFVGLGALNGTTGNVDAAGDTIFAYQGNSDGTSPNTYFGILQLETGQRLIGEPVGLTLDGTVLVTPDASYPTDGLYPEFRSGGETIFLADGVEVRGIATRNSSVAGFRGDGVGDVTLHDIAHFGFAQRGLHLTSLDGPVTATGGITIAADGADTTSFQAVLIANSLPAGTVTIDTLTVTGSAGDGLELADNAGTVSVGGGSIAESAEIGVHIDGGDAATTIDAMVDADATGSIAVRVWNRTGGAVSFGGSIEATSQFGIVIGGTTSTGSNVGTIDFHGPVNLQTLPATPGDGPGVDVAGPSFVPAADGTMTITFHGFVQILEKRNGDSFRITAESSWPLGTQHVRVLGGLDIDTSSVARGISTSSGALTIVDAPGVIESITTSSGQALALLNAHGSVDLEVVTNNNGSAPIVGQRTPVNPAPQLDLDIEFAAVTGSSANTVVSYGLESFRIGSGVVVATTARGLDLRDTPAVDIDLTSLTVLDDGIFTSAVNINNVGGTIDIGTVEVDNTDNGIEITNSSAAITFGTTDIGDATGTSVVRGVSLQSNTGPIHLGDGDITNALQTAFFVNSTSGDITFDGDIVNVQGRSIELEGRIAGTMTFGGLITHNSTLTAIRTQFDLAAATTRFTGGLDLTASNGGEAVVNLAGNGTIEILEPAIGSNTVTSNGALAAIRLDAVAIGAAGVTFDTVNSTGGTRGIQLENVTGPGTFAVTGTGTAGSGGTLSAPVADAIVVTATTAPVDLGLMTVTSPGQRVATVERASDVRFESITASGAGGTEAVRVTTNSGIDAAFTWTGTDALPSSYTGDATEIGVRAFSGSGGADLDLTLDHLDISTVTQGIFISSSNGGAVTATIGTTDAASGDRVSITDATQIGILADAVAGPVALRIDEVTIDGGILSGDGIGFTSSGFGPGALDALIEDTTVGAVSAMDGTAIAVSTTTNTLPGQARVRVANVTAVGEYAIESRAQSTSRIDLTVEGSALSDAGGADGALLEAFGSSQLCIDVNGAADPALANAIGGTVNDVRITEDASATLEVAALGGFTLQQWFDNGNDDGNDPGTALELATNPGVTGTAVGACVAPTVP